MHYVVLIINSDANSSMTTIPAPFKFKEDAERMAKETCHQYKGIGEMTYVIFTQRS